MPTASSRTSSPDPESANPHDALETPPPFLGSWRNVYLFVMGELAVMVLAFWLLARWAS